MSGPGPGVVIAEMDRLEEVTVLCKVEQKLLVDSEAIGLNGLEGINSCPGGAYGCSPEQQQHQEASDADDPFTPVVV